MPHFNLVGLIEAAGYAGLFAVILAESGLFFGFFLPGDSLLFTAGILSAGGVLHLWILIFLLPTAAILGDSIGYWFGTWVGPRLFAREDSFFFDKKHIARAEHFYEQYGPRAILLARFVPVVRTFVPIVAGVGRMRYATFFTYNALGGVLWGAGVLLLGYFLGARFPAVQNYLLPLVVLIVAISLIPVAIEFLREWRRKR